MNNNREFDFFCVGAQKAGTTTLYDILKQHPSLCLSNVKETKFFIDDKKFSLGKEYYFNNYFNKDRKEKITGEIDPDYMFYETSAERILSVFGDKVKIIFLLRNPVERAYSHYLMTVRRGWDTLSFEDAILQEKERIKINDHNKRIYSYISRGLYSSQVNEFLRIFPRENIKIYLFESDIKENIHGTIKDISDFIGLDNYKFKTEKVSNPSSKPYLGVLRDWLYKDSRLKRLFQRFVSNPGIRKTIFRLFDRINQKKINKTVLSGELKLKIMNEYFIKDIKNLERITGKDFHIWYSNDNTND